MDLIRFYLDRPRSRQLGNWGSRCHVSKQLNCGYVDWCIAMKYRTGWPGIFVRVGLPLMGKYLTGVVGSPSSTRSWSMFSCHYFSFCWMFFFRNSNTWWNRQWRLVAFLMNVIFDPGFRFIWRAAWVAWLCKFRYFFLLSVLCPSVFKPNLGMKWKQ